jgi:hypothetical protein
MMAMIRRAIAPPALALALGVLSGCNYSTQTSPGKDYLAAQPEWSAAARTADTRPAPGGRQEMAQAVAEAANAEPLLRFPARIGLARIERQRISSHPFGGG